MKLKREFGIINFYEVNPCNYDGDFDQYDEDNNKYHPVNKFYRGATYYLNNTDKYLYYEKRFKNGLLIYETNCTKNDNDVIITKTKILHYDKDSRISNELVSIVEDKYGIEDNRFEINYEYNKNGYRKISKKTYTGSQSMDQDNLYQLLYFEEDKIDSLLEVKMVGDKKLSEVYVSLANRINRRTNYIYNGDQLLEIDGYHEIEDDVFFKSKYEYSYDGILINEVHYDEKGELILQRKFNNGSLVEYFKSYPLQAAGTWKCCKITYEYDLKKQIDFRYDENFFSNSLNGQNSKIIYLYDDQSNLEKVEHYKKAHFIEYIYQIENCFYETITVKNIKSIVLTKRVIKNRINLPTKEEELGLTNVETKDNFKLYSAIEYEYDSNGNLNKEKHFDIEGLNNIITYSYSKFSNKLIEIMYQTTESNAPYKTINYREEYDTEGNVTRKMITEISNGRIEKESVINYTYESDEVSQQESEKYFSIRNEYLFAD